MKTKTPADPAKLKELSRTFRRLLRTRGGELALHAQLRTALLDSIHAGHWVAGDRLPPETDLAAATKLSMGTVQRAMRDLTEDGVVRRQQGSGSFVAHAPHRIDDVAHCRFLDDDGVVLPVFSQVVGRRAVGHKGPWGADFPVGAKLLRLDRVFNVNDEFQVFSSFYFDSGRFRGLASRALSELAGINFKVLLAEEAAAPPGASSQTMRLVRAPEEVAQHMGVERGSCVAQLDIARRIAGSTEVFYYMQMFVPPTERKLATQDYA